MTVARAVISIVPSTAGHIPPTFAGATFGGIGWPVRKDQLMTEAPLAITVYSTNPSGMITTTNEMIIKAVAMRSLVCRQPVGRPRSTCCGSAVTAIRHLPYAGRSGPRSPARSC